jgi:hypothetical protein
MDSVGKWGAGAAYGPVLSRTDLYLLHMSGSVKLELNPIMSGSHDTFQLQFWLIDGTTGGFNATGNDTPFTDKDQPATLPRVQELYIITEHSPWCTTVRNEAGVTMGDVCQTVWKEYTDNFVTDVELNSLHARTQEQVKRAAMVNNQTRSQQGYGMYHTQSQLIRRVDWLRDRNHFDRLIQNDAYAEKRLGFKAPNVFVMNLIP